MVSFDVTAGEMAVIREIAKRACELFPQTADLEQIEMDVTVTHANGNPLDLETMLDSQDNDFMHDIAGIYLHLNRDTGKLMDCFDPRFSVRR